MNDYPVLKNAPILEALLDIQVTLPQDVELNRLVQLQEFIGDRFPSRSNSTIAEFAFSMEEGEAHVSVPSQGQNGYLFKSIDNKKIVQARNNGFSFSQLKPYDHWDVFHNEAKELWEYYERLTHPVSINRIALRYINRLDLPIPFNDFRDYLLTSPEVGPSLPNGLANFFFRLVIPKDHLIANVTLAMEAVDDTNKILPVIFDIDVYTYNSLDISEFGMWEVFQSLRAYKDNLFFGSLTEKGLELFK